MQPTHCPVPGKLPTVFLRPVDERGHKLPTVFLRPVDERGHMRRVGVDAVLEAGGVVESHGVDVRLNATHERRGTAGAVAHLTVGRVRLRGQTTTLVNGRLQHIL